MDTLADNAPDLKLIGPCPGDSGDDDAAASVTGRRPNVLFDVSSGGTGEEHGEKRG